MTDKKHTLADIQQKLKVPKNQKNNFGNYNYRSCEDIVEMVKPLLGETPLILSDEVRCVGDKNYIVATAQWGEHQAQGWAREAETKKGMDDAQITGAASSYARKYALNGLFAIDDTKDADATNTHDKAPTQASAPAKAAPKQPAFEAITYDDAVAELDACRTRKAAQELYVRANNSPMPDADKKGELLAAIKKHGSTLGE